MSEKENIFLEEEEVVENLPRIKELKDIWEEYFSHVCLMNPWQIEPTFHVLLGTVLKSVSKDLTVDERAIKFRTHYFCIQDSRTGKGQGIYATNQMLQGFQDSTFKISGKKTPKMWVIKNEPTPQELISNYLENEEREKILHRKNLTSEEKSNALKMPKKIEVQGLLNKYDYVGIEEGELIFDTRPVFGMRMREVFLTALDEPGYTVSRSKSSRDEEGNPSVFPVSCVIHAGSALTPEMKRSIFEKGLLNRFLITYRRYDYKEIGNIQKSSTKARSEEYREIAKDKIDEFVKSFYSKKYNCRIKIDKETIEKYSREKHELRNDLIENIYSGEKMKFLDTYFSSLYEMDLKIACHVCALANESLVKYEHLLYGRYITEKTIPMYSKLIEDAFGIVRNRTKMEIFQIINEVLEKNGGELGVYSLANELIKLSEIGKWDMGRNKTIDKIKYLVKQGVLSERKGAKNEKVISMEKSFRS